MKLSDVVNKVVKLAEAIRNYRDAELHKRYPRFPMVDSTDLTAEPSAPQEKELRDLLEKLPEDFIYELAMIMYLGRGDFSTKDVPDQHKEIRTTFSQPQWAISQMLSKAPLGEYLSDGLAELERNGIDVDTLVPATANQ